MTTVANTELNVSEMQHWLAVLHGDSPGLAHICSTGDWSGRAFDLSSDTGLDDATSYVQELDRLGRQGIYLRATTVRQAPAAGSRGAAHDTLSFPGFWADLDIAGPGHAEQNLPRDEAEARKIIEVSGLPEPTLWIHSGGGLYPWWLLTNPHIVSHDLPELQAMSEAWQRVIGHAADKLGLKYGTGVHDLARVLRIPGTINRKTDQPRPCHMLDQSGRPYTLHDLKTGLAHAVSLLPAPQPRTAPRPAPTGNGHGELSPFDDYETRTDWADILEPAGWTYSHQTGHTRYWCRPGKDRRDGHSASTGLDTGRDRMFVFTTATELEAWTCHTKAYVYTTLNHGGDMRAAARTLSGLGYGTRAVNHITVPDMMRPRAIGSDGAAAGIIMSGLDFEWTESGNGEHFTARHQEKFKYVPQMKGWMAWDGKVWERDEDSLKVHQECRLMFKDMLAHAKAEGDEKYLKWAYSCQTLRRVQTATSLARMAPEMNSSVDSFDKQTHLVTCNNGVLNLKTFQLQPHDPKNLLTRSVNASYNPAAKAERFVRFMEEVLPDVEVRQYVQRLLGYTLKGVPNQRAVVVLSGPSGTGKSKFIEAIQHVFGTMGATAASSTFRRHRSDDAGLDPQLHALRGARFVATSESSDDSRLDTELIKRVTGLDQITSRTLHETPQTWIPRLVLWMATNYQPKAADDDAAIWARIKTVRFEQQFTVDGSSGMQAQTNLLEELQAEADGILTWIVEGLKDFEENGLGEPQAVAKATEDYRRENDTVEQFIEQSLDQGVLIGSPESTISFQELYAKYRAWCQSEGVPQRGSVRFSRRVVDLGYSRGRTSTERFFEGLRRGGTFVVGWQP